MRIRKYPKNTPMLVQWVDIQADSAWQDDDEASCPDPATCWTVGFFTSCDKDTLVLCGTVSGGQRDKLSIPKGVVKRIIVLSEMTTDNSIRKIVSEE